MTFGVGSNIDGSIFSTNKIFVRVFGRLFLVVVVIVIVVAVAVAAAADDDDGADGADADAAAAAAAAAVSKFSILMAATTVPPPCSS